MTAKHITWVESEHAFRIIDNDGTAFVANYSRLEDAEHALYLICRQDWQAVTHVNTGKPAGIRETQNEQDNREARQGHFDVRREHEHDLEWESRAAEAQRETEEGQ